MASKSSTTACQTAWNPDQQPIPFANPWGRPGAYTTMLVDGDPPTPLFLDRHLRRLKKCLGHLGLPEIFRDAFLEESILETASGINTVPCMLRTAVVPEGLFITAYPQSGKGARLHGRLCRIRRKLPAAKSLLDISLHEEMQTVNRNREELLLVSPDGHVLEGATTNLLFVRGKNILAPEKDTLTGITRQVLEERIPEPWQWEVTDVHLDDLPEMDEILVCGSGKEVAQIINIADSEWKPRSNQAFMALSRIYGAAKLLYLRENSSKNPRP